MTVDAGKLLVEKIVPRLRAGIPKSVPAFGAEDHEELIQDAIASAAMMLDRLETIGKQVTPGNIAYYCILNSRCGRRSTGSNRTDVMAPGAQLAKRSALHSLEEIVGYAEECGGPVTLGELLAGNHEDPATAAARNLDWSEFIEDVDQRQLTMIFDALEGKTITSSVRKRGIKYPTIRKLKAELVSKVHEDFGTDILQEVTRRPAWQAGLIAEREKAACKATHH
jgi:hypothetical protein